MITAELATTKHMHDQAYRLNDDQLQTMCDSARGLPVAVGFDATDIIGRAVWSIVRAGKAVLYIEPSGKFAGVHRNISSLEPIYIVPDFGMNTGEAVGLWAVEKPHNHWCKPMRWLFKHTGVFLGIRKALS